MRTLNLNPTAGDLALVAPDISQHRRAEQQLHELVNGLNIVIWEVDVAAACLSFVNDTVEQMLGYPAQQFTADSTLWRRIVHPEDYDATNVAYFRTIAEACPLDLEQRVTTADGRTVWLHASGAPVLDDAGRVTAVRGWWVDITAAKQTQAALQAAETRYRTLVEHLPAAVYIEDFGTRLSYIGPYITKLTGCTPDEWTANPGLRLAMMHPDDRERVLAELARTDATGEPFSVEFRYIARDGRTVWVRSEARLLCDAQGQPLCWQGFLFDITDRKELEAKLARQAFHDALTGLPNRTLMFDRIQQALAGARRLGREVAILFLDLDNFKVINDSLGHSAGNELLVQVAHELQYCLRAEDTASRFGGDEFAILLPNIAAVGDAMLVAQRIKRRLKRVFAAGGRHVNITTSIGIAITRGGEADAEEVLRRADIAMYRAKSKGKDGFDVFDSEMHDDAVARLELEHDLRHAIDHDELVLFYQPIVTLATGAVSGMEALVRWQHPKRGLVPPGEFIPLAEEAGLIIPLGRWVLGEACRQLRRWCEQMAHDRPFILSVNLSARQFQHAELVDDIAHILAEAGVDPNRIALEVTESAVVDDAEAAIARLFELKALGLRIGIDDFGTGYSSLTYLKRFPVDALKIDRTFVAGLGTDPNDTAIVAATITLGHALGLRMVAEGVETEHQLAHLHALACDVAQGYYLGKPVPVHEIDVRSLDRRSSPSPTADASRRCGGG